MDVVIRSGGRADRRCESTWFISIDREFGDDTTREEGEDEPTHLVQVDRHAHRD